MINRILLPHLLNDIYKNQFFNEIILIILRNLKNVNLKIEITGISSSYIQKSVNS